jgi:phage terminase small subunit
MTTETKLTENELRFIDLITSDLRWDATAAYARAFGCGPNTAATNGSKIMKRPAVKEEIDRRLAERREAAKIKAEDMLLDLLRVVTADSRDLCEYYRGACRYCHGDMHRYQRTQAEYERELQAYKTVDANQRGGPKDPLCLSFDPKGGIGYNPKRDPHPDCPECYGDGIGYEVFKDTRTLPPAAARLYAGIKKTREGLEFKVRNQDKNLEYALRHLGLLEQADEGDDDLPPTPVAVTFEIKSARKGASDGDAD